MTQSEMQQMIDSAVMAAMSKTRDETEERYIDTPEAAAHVGLKEQTLRVKAMRNQIPFHRAGRRLRFLKSELNAWMESQ